jgi:L,D-transpeptidase YcbB
MKPRQHLLAIPALACALLIHPAAGAAQPGEPGAATIQALAAQPLLPAAPHPWDGSDWLRRFYAPRGFAPAWSPALVRAALAVLDAAPTEGLDPADYGVEELRAQQQDRVADPARFDVGLTAAMLHYLADLRLGRVRSEYQTDDLDERPPQFDPVELLRGALARNGLGEAAAAAEPPVPLYARTKHLLAQYRALAEQPRPRLPAPGGKIGPGGRYKGARLLHERLVAGGDARPDAPAPKRGVYDAALAGGVRRFQARHGLPETGVLDDATVAAMNVPAATRVRELELTLERLRWLPGFDGGSVIAVSLPVYRLWAFDRADPAGPPLEMRVIVGAAAKTPTPLLIGQMRYLEFNPYWNVPRSIVLREILPKLELDPGYLAASDMEVVGHGTPTSSVDAATIERLRAGKLRVRQRPGPRNSLGAVKFAMPNPMDIYLHSTPARKLFRRTRRDLSHGCIRVEQPAVLAQFVLRDQPQWEVDEIQAAMAPGPTRRVNLSKPIPVVLFYATAIADREGRALFARDVYQLNGKLEQALHEHGVHARAAIAPAPQPPTG